MSAKRQPKGIPVGGQFAANEHDEASSSLSAGTVIVSNDEFFRTEPNREVDHVIERIPAIKDVSFVRGTSRGVADDGTPYQDYSAYRMKKNGERQHIAEVTGYADGKLWVRDAPSMESDADYAATKRLSTAIHEGGLTVLPISSWRYQR